MHRKRLMMRKGEIEPYVNSEILCEHGRLQLALRTLSRAGSRHYNDDESIISGL